MPSPEAFRAAVAEQGFNLFGVLHQQEYDALVPPAFRSAAIAPTPSCALIVGNGGRAMWDAIAGAPEQHMTHRIDRFTERVITAAALAHLPSATLLWPWTKRGNAYVPLMALGHAAGFGAPSRLQMLIHPVYGLWTGLRAVVLAAAEVPLHEDPDTANFDPCPACHAPCVNACHGSAVGAAGFNGDRCIQSRVLRSPCRSTCDARLACPVGAEHRYSPAQMRHHSRRLLHSGAFMRHMLSRVGHRFTA